MFTVTDAFKAAEAADVNHPVGQALLVLGDYANADAYGATAQSSGDASADYPRTGPLNGDRTEINIGAAATADNGIGLSSWKSSGIPSSGAYVWWLADLGRVRTINRIKLYHRAGHGCRQFLIEASEDQVSWYPIIITSPAAGAGLGYGEGGFGDGPYGGDGGTPGTVVNTTMDLDTVDFTDISARYVRVTVGDTEVAGEPAEIVAFEVYRLVDITSRVLEVHVNRSRDYKLQSNIAATASLTLDNSDRYFSRRYTPTDAEVAAGFINSELRSGLGLIVKLGFAYNGEEGELVTKFVGTVDELEARASGEPNSDAIASIRARDTIKQVIDAVVSAALKEGEDISVCVTYLLNLANISNYEMVVNTTTIELDYFFTFQTSVLTSLQQLVQAVPDAEFYLTEEGIATFAVYAIPASHTDTTQADFQAAVTQTNLNLTTIPGAVKRRWIIIDDFDGDSAPKSFWADSGGGTWTCSGNELHKSTPAGAGVMQLVTYIIPDESGFVTLARGTWELKQWLDDNVNDNAARTWLIINNILGFGSPAGLIGYYLEVTPTVTRLIHRERTNAPFTENTVISVARAGASTDVYRVTRDDAGLFTLYINGSSVGTGVSNPANLISSTGYFCEGVANAGVATVQNWDSLYYSQEVLAPATAYSASTPTIESANIDQTADVQSEGIFEASTDAPAGSEVTFYTKTSADGVSYDPDVAAQVNAAIDSTTRRYIRWKATLTYTGTTGFRDARAGGIIYDATVNWSQGQGTPKVHTEVDFTLNEGANFDEVNEKVSGSIGGDTSIYNDIAVTSAPLLLTGADTDTVWQGVAGTPAAAVSAGNPLTLSSGDNDFYVVVPQGMDISQMAGATPAAAAVTFGTAVGTVTFARIHPTKPVLRINIATPGTITDLRVIGKAFSSAQTPYQALAADAASIGLNSRKQLPITNNFIVSQNVAQLIANRQLLNFKDEVGYVDGLKLGPMYSMQTRDRLKLVEGRTLDLNHDYTVVGIEDYLAVSGDSVEAGTRGTLVAIT